MGRRPAQALALPDGVEPVAAMRADDLARLDVNDLAFLLAHEAAQEVVVVYLAEEADALTVLASGTRQLGIEGNPSHLLLHQVPDGEERVAELFVAELSQEVGLVLYGVFGCAQPHQAVPLDVRGIVPRGDIVVVMTHASSKAPNLMRRLHITSGLGVSPCFTRSMA